MRVQAVAKCPLTSRPPQATSRSGGADTWAFSRPFRCDDDDDDEVEVEPEKKGNGDEDEDEDEDEEHWRGGRRWLGMQTQNGGPEVGPPLRIG